jgi:drug efflux transport system ATP-binding protein
MVAGELVAEGTPDEIKGRQEGTLLELSVDKPQFAADVLKQDLDRWRISLFGDRLHVISDDTPNRGIERTRSRLARHGIRVLSARDVTFSLEDVFIAVVEKARQQGKVALDN